MSFPKPPTGFRFLERGRLVTEVGSADTAARRLRYVLALDRAKLDGRRRVTDLYGGPGNRIVFDEPLPILPDETLTLDYDVTPDGLRGFATIQRTFPGEDRIMNTRHTGALPLDRRRYQPEPPHRCQFCGAPSWIEPCDQTPPPDYCHPEDHGSPDDAH